MGYLEKYKTNREWAESAYQEAVYDVATNRYYYSIFQKILFRLNEAQLEIDNEDNEGSHNATARNYVEQVINKKKPSIAMKERTKFNGVFQTLKKFRHTADYKMTGITEEQAKEVKKIFNELDLLIK